MNNKTSGFTLIELVIVVAIISILTAVAMPSFLDYQRKTARTQAKGVMLDIAQKQERYFTNRGSYLAFPAAPTALSGAATAFQNYSGSDINSRKFSIKVEAGDTADITTSYLITADASNGYTDPLCSTMTLASSSATKSPSACW